MGANVDRRSHHWRLDDIQILYTLPHGIEVQMAGATRQNMGTKRWTSAAKRQKVDTQNTRCMAHRTGHISAPLIITTKKRHFQAEN